MGAGLANVGCGDHGRGLSVGENMGQFALAVQDVDRNEDHAQLDAGEIHIDHLHAVGKINAKPVAQLQPALSEQQSQAITARVDLAESVGCAFEFESGLVPASGERKIKKVKKVQRPKIAWPDRRQSLPVEAYQSKPPPRNCWGTNWEPPRSASVKPKTKNWLGLGSGFPLGSSVFAIKSLSLASQRV